MTTIISSPLPLSHFSTSTSTINRKRSSTTNMELTPTANTTSDLFVFTPTLTPGSKRMRVSMDVPPAPRHCYYTTTTTDASTNEEPREFFPPTPVDEKENPSFLWIPSLDEDNDYPEPLQMSRPVKLKPRFRFSEIDDNDKPTLPAPRPIPPQQPLAAFNRSISLSLVFPASAPLMPQDEEDHHRRYSMDKENTINANQRKSSPLYSKSHSFADSATGSMGLLSLLPRNNNMGMLLQQPSSGSKTVLRRSSSLNVV